jgi:hypothetical protein
MRRAQLLMRRAAWRELQRLEDDAVLSPRVYAQLDAFYRTAGQHLDAELEGLYQSQAELEAEELRATREHLLEIERVSLQALQRRGLVDSDTAGKLAGEVDAELLILRSGGAVSLQTPSLGPRAPAGSDEPGQDAGAAQGPEPLSDEA